jgi:cyanophycin synthetase
MTLPLELPADLPADAAAPAAPPDPQDFVVGRVRAMRGPNYWRLAPVIACDVRLGAFEQVTSAQLPGFTARLLAALPSLGEHPCSPGRPGGFVARLERGTRLPHILEHVALEFQALAGSDVHFGRVVASGDPGVWWVIVAYEEEEVGLDAVAEAAELLRACIAGGAAYDAYDVAAAAARLARLHERVRLGPSTAAIVEEARRRGIPVRRLNSRSLVQLGLGRHLRRIQATVTDFTSLIGAEVAQNKEDTRRVLAHVGLPAPQGGVARSPDEARALARRIGYPVILKPLNLNHGRGISDRLDTPEALDRAWEATSALVRDAGAASPRLIVETFAAGRDHRVLVVGGRVVACAERVPAHVVGDGARSVRDLVAEANRDPRAAAGTPRCSPSCRATSHRGVPRPPRPVARQRAGGGRDGVPARHRQPEHRRHVDRPHRRDAPRQRDRVRDGRRRVGLDVAGIDVLTPDISVPFRENGAVIIEVNAGPGIRMHTHPREGPARNVAAPIVDMLYEPGQPTSIPVDRGDRHERQDDHDAARRPPLPPHRASPSASPPPTASTSATAS